MNTKTYLKLTIIFFSREKLVCKAGNAYCKYRGPRKLLNLLSFVNTNVIEFKLSPNVKNIYILDSISFILYEFQSLVVNGQVLEMTTF